MNSTSATPDGSGARLLDAADRALMAIETFLAGLAGLVILVLMFVGVIEILSRSLFNAPIYGHLDVVELTMISYTVLCVSYCWRKAAHVRMDLLLRRFSGRARWSTELVTTALALVFVSLVLPGTWQYFHNAWEIGDSAMNTGLPTWPSKLAVPVGLGILWLRLALEMLAYLRLIADPLAIPVAIPAPPDPTKDAVD
jgi:TRAP-type C4-dicarboxylate transport system permease small subunit